MLSKFNEKAQKIVAVAESIAFDFGHVSVGSEHLLLSFLKIKDNKLRMILAGYSITYEKIKDQIISLFGKKDNKPYYMEYTASLKKIIDNSYIEAKKNKEEKVTPDILAYTLMNSKENVAIELLNKNNVDSKEVLEILKRNIKKISELDSIDDLVNINLFMKNKEDEIIERDEEVIELMEALLRKQKPNALILGDPGVGKTSIVYHLASLINKGKVSEKLKNKVIYELDISNVVAGTKYRGEFEEKLKKILKKVKEDPNAIIFIDEIHNIIGAGGAEGAIDASNILKPYLSRGEIQLIGATTFDEYSKIFEKEKALERRFQVIKLLELSKQKTINVLYHIIDSYKKFHNLEIEENLLENIVNLTNHYMTTRFFPDKAIDVLDSSFVKAKQLDKKIVTKEDVIEVIEKQCKVLINKDDDELDLYNLLKENILGQDEALLKINNDINLIEKGLIDNNRPLGVYLFIGPTGVGKTETAKLIAKKYFGDESRLIKIDMSMFMEAHSVSKLIGAPPGYIGYDNQTYIIDEIRKNPHSVILLDEIEKAHKEVLNIFLNVFDEGYFIDSNKRKIDFRNSLIILTSNLGFTNDNINKKTLGFLSEDANKIEIEKAVNKHFKPEFINRLDDIIYFKSLNLDSSIELANIYINEYNKTYNYEISQEKIEDLIKTIDVNKYGARGIKREVKKYISNLIKEEKLTRT